VVDCTWNDREAEIVLRNLRRPNEEQQRLRGYYLKLREEYRKALRLAQSGETERRRPER
jgi:hypothetical protein